VTREFTGLAIRSPILSETVLNNGFNFRVGGNIHIQPAASGADGWELSAPPGLTIDATTGLVTGKLYEVGRHLLSWTALKGTLRSLPLDIPLKISQDGSFDPATDRFSWLASAWHLTDLQVDLVKRSVSSSRLVPRIKETVGTDDAGKTVILTSEAKRLVFKPNDDIIFAVLFLLSSAPQTVSGLTKIRVCIRPEGQLDDPFFFESVSAPVANTSNDDPYYEVSGKLTEAAGDKLVTALARARTKNVPLLAVADVEITVSARVYSSQTFEVEIEEDVARDD
jgi:hypothetical protein